MTSYRYHLGGYFESQKHDVHYVPPASIDSTDVFATFFVSISNFCCGLCFIMAFSFPKMFVVSEIRWSAERPTRTRCQAWLNIFFPPGNDHIYLSSQHYFWSLVTDIYTDLKMEMILNILIYYIHVFFSKRVVYRFYDHFGVRTTI